MYMMYVCLVSHCRSLRARHWAHFLDRRVTSLRQHTEASWNNSRQHTTFKRYMTVCVLLKNTYQQFCACVMTVFSLRITRMLIVYVIPRSFGWSAESGDGRRKRSSPSADRVVRPARRRLLRIRLRWTSSNRRKHRSNNVSCEVYFK